MPSRPALRQVPRQDRQLPPGGGQLVLAAGQMSLGDRPLLLAADQFPWATACSSRQRTRSPCVRANSWRHSTEAPVPPDFVAQREVEVADGFRLRPVSAGQLQDGHGTPRRPPAPPVRSRAELEVREPDGQLLPEPPDAKSPLADVGVVEENDRPGTELRLPGFKIVSCCFVGVATVDVEQVDLAVGKALYPRRRSPAPVARRRRSAGRGGQKAGRTLPGHSSRRAGRLSNGRRRSTGLPVPGSSRPGRTPNTNRPYGRPAPRRTGAAASPPGQSRRECAHTEQPSGSLSLLGTSQHRENSKGVNAGLAVCWKGTTVHRTAPSVDRWRAVIVTPPYYHHRRTTLRPAKTVAAAKRSSAL